MITKNTLHFLENLSLNNNKEWFDANRKSYEEAKQTFLALTQHILNEVVKWDSSIVQVQPKDCVFRINRDVRFSKNKEPYKTNMGLNISRGGKKINTAGYYFHLQPNACFVGGGLYMPMADDLKKIRQEIDYNHQEFEDILHAKSFNTYFKKLEDSKEHKLTRPPKGYDESNTAIEFLKLKSFIATCPVSNEDVLGGNLEKIITNHFKAIYPLIQFLNKALEN